MIIGIDFGTLQSAAAFWTPAGAQLVPNALGERFTPSVVGVADDGGLVVGRAAEEDHGLPADRRADGFKRELGSDRKWLLNQREWTAQQLAALVLRSLKEDAEIHLGQAVQHAVIAVPSGFHPAQRQSLREAGRLAGLDVVRLINGSTAAALAAVSHPSRESKVGVSVVWGADSLDLAVVEFFPGAVEVRAVGGAPVVRPAPESREAGSEDSAAFQGAGETENRWIESLLEQIESIAKQCLDDAGFRSQHVDLLILAGSGPCLPVVREWLETRFPNAAEGCFPPQELVARGAAVFAGHLAGGAGLQDLAVSEVACHSLTAAVLPAADAEPADCGYCPLIGRGTPLPAGCQQRFATTRANQTELHFRLYQGEQRDEPGNLLVDEFVLQGIPAAAERSEIGVRFAYDADELLRIEVALSKPQEQALLTIRRPRPATTAEQLALAATELQAIWNLRRSSSPR